MFEHIIVLSVLFSQLLLGTPSAMTDDAAAQRQPQQPSLHEPDDSEDGFESPLDCGNVFVEVPPVTSDISWGVSPITSPAVGLNDEVTPTPDPAPSAGVEDAPVSDDMAEPTPDPRPASGSVAQRFVASCEGQLEAWQAGDVPDDRYWRPWNDEPSPWCSEFVGWNLRNIGLVEGETMPPDPSYAAAYYSFYSEHPELAEIHENDGSYIPRDGDIVLFSEFAHTEMVTHVDEDGEGWEGISGGSSVGSVHRSLSDGECWMFVTLLG